MEKTIATLKELFQAWSQDPTALAIGGAVLLVFLLGWCRLFSRTGHHGSLGLLMLVPGANLLLFLYLAYGPWPLQRELKGLRHFERAARRAEDLKERAA